MPVQSSICEIDARIDLSADCINVKRGWKMATDKQKKNIICTDNVDRVSGTRMDSLRPSDLKKEESINRSCDFSVRWPLVLDVFVCERCFYTEFLFVAFVSSRLKLARKLFLAFRHARSTLCLDSRRETILIEAIVDGRWSTDHGQYYILNSLTILTIAKYMLSIILIFIRFACTTANLWRRPDQWQQQFRKKGAVQFNRNVEHKLQVFSDNFCAVFFTFIFCFAQRSYDFILSSYSLSFLVQAMGFRSHSLEEQKQFSSTRKWSINRCQWELERNLLIKMRYFAPCWPEFSFQSLCFGYYFPHHPL